MADAASLEAIRTNILAQLTIAPNTYSGLKYGLRPPLVVNAGMFRRAMKNLLASFAIELDPDNEAPIDYFRIWQEPPL